MEPPHTFVVPTVYGNMVLNRHDTDRTTVVVRTGRAFDHGEIECVVPFTEPGSVAVDVGSYFGFWSLALSKRAATVHSFEAQRFLHNCLCGTLALNGIENVFPHNTALGAANGTVEVPVFDYTKELLFGGIYLCQKTSHGDLGQAPRGHETTPLATLDSFGFSNVSLIKIDVEGMELDVLQGAQETIRRSRPVIYSETILGHKDRMLHEFKRWEYFVLSNPGNLLAIPREKLDRYRGHIQTVFSLEGYKA